MLAKKVALCLILNLLWSSIAFAKYPVLILPGINSTSQDMKDGCLVTTLKNAGIDVFTMADVGKEFLNRGQGLIQEDVKLLKQAIDEVKRRTGSDKVDIVAYSRGGLVAELYTMMYGNQYQSTMEYTYYPAGVKREERFKKTKTISNIPRYGNDINQIIMLGAPNKGSFGANVAYSLPWLANLVDEIANIFGHDPPDADTVGMEQLRTSNNFMTYFWQKALNPEVPKVKYINLAEDRIDNGDGVVSFDSAKGVELHQQLLETIALSTLNIPSVHHTNLFKDVGVKKEILQEEFDAYPITANISILRESPVREGAISISITLSESLSSAPTLFIKGNGAFSSPHPISLAGSGKNFSVILNISKGTDGSARLYFEEKTQMQVKIASADCKEDIIETIEVPISGYHSFLIDTEEPEVTATTPANGEVIIAEETPWTVNISATLFDPPVNSYASGIDNSTIVLNTPQGTFHQASAVNNLDYGEYSCSIEAKDNANTPGHDLKGSPYRWSFEIVPPIFVSIHPAWQDFTEPHESHTHYITITNKAKNKSFTANIEMKLIRASKCLSITQYPASTLELPANSEKSTSFVVTSGEELIPDDNLIHQIKV
ncbi:MAG: hypothetical protein AB1422_05365 [bacterium]